MCADVSSKIARRSSCVSAHHAADFRIGNQRGRRRLGTAEVGLHRDELRLLLPRDVALVAGHAAQDPSAAVLLRHFSRHDAQPIHELEAIADHGALRYHFPGSGVAADEREQPPMAHRS